MVRAAPPVLVSLLMVSVVLAGCLVDDENPEDEAPGGDVPPRPEDSGSLPADDALAQTGRWLAPFDGEVPAINMALLHTGEVLYWSGVEAYPGTAADVPFLVTPPQKAESRVLDLATMSVATPGMPDGGAADLFCSGQTILPDGRVVVGGGTEYHGGPNEDTPFVLDGSRDARIYDPATRNWTVVDDMILGRWYPSLIKDGGGHAVAASGIGALSDPQEQWAQWERYNATEDAWSEVAGTDQLLPLYPRVSVVPGGPLKGQVFYNTIGTLWGPFGEHPRQSEWSYQYAFDEGAGWTRFDLSTFPVRQHGASVMLPVGPEDDYAPTFVNFGGSLYQSPAATPVTEITDLSSGTPSNRMGPEMAHARWHLNGVGLPDGTVLAIGGGLLDNVVLYGAENVPVMAVEQYDPATDAWTELAEMTVPRMYHSTALLLPDGRVLAGGHVPLPVEPSLPYEQVQEKRLEVFEPPYLFRGERPVVWSTPEHVGYGAEFQARVDVADGDLDSLVLVSPGATTHAFDANQRTILLDWEAGGDHNVTVTAPPDGDVAPPGWYMLFANKAHPDGAVPSEAAWIHIA